MNFDINQDFSNLQNVRRNRGKGIRPGKPKAKPSAPAVPKPVENQPTQGSCVPSAPHQNAALPAVPASPIDAVVTARKPDHALPTANHLAVPRSRQPGEFAQSQSILQEQAAGMRMSEPPLPEDTVARHTGANVSPIRPVEQPPQASYVPEAAEEGSPSHGPEHAGSPVVGDGRQGQRHKAPARKRSVPELGTNISKKPVKPRKRRKKVESSVPQLEPAEYESSLAVVSCDATGEDVEQPPLTVTKAVVNHYDEMTRALCAGKRPKGKRKKIDPTAPIDPKNMTLMDVIRHAHSNANILDRQYKDSKASQEKEKAQAAVVDTEDTPAPPEPHDSGPSSDRNPLAPQLVLRDGRIVVDQGSLTVQANAPIGVRTVEVEEDDDTLINSHSYLPVSKLTKERWTQQETELFYQVLRSYGADFTFMSQCFQGRTRKQVKNKYLKEERVNPARVKEAMSGSQTATLAQLTSLAQPGTAAADIAAMLPEGEGVPDSSTVMRQACREAEDDECLGMAVDPTMADFFY